VLKQKLNKIDAIQASTLAWMELPYDYIIGVDEVGRGCLAGPVVASSVVFTKSKPSSWSTFKDSKTLSEIKRNELSTKIKKNTPIHWAGVINLKSMK
jgi:ribonuclease HII